jgi:hypothetical protein
VEPTPDGNIVPYSQAQAQTKIQETLGNLDPGKTDSCGPTVGLFHTGDPVTVRITGGKLETIRTGIPGMGAAGSKDVSCRAS